MTRTVAVRDYGRTWTYSFDDLMRYHGSHSPGGVAVAFTAMARSFAILSPDEPPPRREIRVRTAFRGPGARDGFEMATRAVTDGRYVVDREILRPDRGRLLEDFVFEIGLGAESVTLLLRDGFVTDEFIDLARAERRTDDQEAHFMTLKERLAQQVLAAPPTDVFEVS